MIFHKKQRERAGVGAKSSAEGGPGPAQQVAKPRWALEKKGKRNNERDGCVPGRVQYLNGELGHFSQHCRRSHAEELDEGTVLFGSVPGAVDVLQNFEIGIREACTSVWGYCV